MSNPSFDHESFTARFLTAIEGVHQATDPLQSSRVLRKLVKSKELRFTDMSDNPEKFFMAHRLLATTGLGGFGIRFTVQFNLFAGSIVGLAGPEQLKMLDEIQEKGQLGCFLLTEMQAGVLSGLIVETTADWDEATQEFILQTPNDKAAKNWISQGYTAELGVVIANLRIQGKSYGPHAFHMRLREGEEGPLLKGIRIDDMGTKTVANDLDNARVWFDQVRLPKQSLLNKFADIENNQYVQKREERMRIEVIGQRLLTGRLAIAEAALISCRVLHMRTEKYARKKICNGLSGEKVLYEMPQLQSIFSQSYAELDHMIGYVAAVEDDLNRCLREGTIPDNKLVDAISVCKIQAIKIALERAHTLRQEVGSYALMYGTGFELMDMLLCCKFAEGDSRILQMKLSRDRMKRVAKDGILGTLSQIMGPNSDEAITALRLAFTMDKAGKDIKKLDQVYTESWVDVYALSELIEQRYVKSYDCTKTFMEPIEDRLTAAGTVYDHEWKKKLLQKGME
jgi:acyl-CoA oxidase